MLDPKSIRLELDSTAIKLRKKNFDLDKDKITGLEHHRKTLQLETESLQNERNLKSKAVGKAKAAGEDVSDILSGMDALKSELDQKKQQLEGLQDQMQGYLLRVPNIPSDDVPEGKDESNNKMIDSWGTPRKFEFEAKDHAELGENLKEGLEFSTATKLTGSRFVVMRGGIARMHRALIQFMLDTHSLEHGYTEFNVPYIVNEASLKGTSQLPKFEEDLFKLHHDPSYYLIPTAEVPLTNMVRGKILQPDSLPLKYTAHTPCFRSEAGSYGKDTKGMIRQHQFEKIELVQIVKPENSEEALEELTSHAEIILQKLELPYQKVILCGGDLGFGSAKTYDLEVWLPSQGMYREISSCSSFTDFQARRMQARWRNPNTGKPELVHTINGSGVAVGRALVAIMENYQEKSGHIRIPAVLKKYMPSMDYLE
ncbi:MAG: serine--tRNA ligase [Gammaproteobacteria bacterium]|nr:serine--tRNA ligase [Gammaproteobacteria bacterium]